MRRLRKGRLGDVPWKISMMSKRGRKPGQGAGHHELRVETQLGCGLGLGQEAEGRGGTTDDKAFLHMSPCSRHPHDFSENGGFLSLLCKWMPKG